MKIRSLVTVGVIACVLAALVLPGGVAAGKAKKKPQVLATDPADDWGSNADPTLQPMGDALGQELVEASMGMADAKTVNFIIKLNSLPPWGGIPESSRYGWDFTVDGELFQLTGAFTDYIRGVCNPLHTGECPPPKDPGQQPFHLRQGPCTVGSDCFVRGVIQAKFDPATATITIPVPLELLKAKPGSKIGPGVGPFGAGVYAAPALLVSQASLPSDNMPVLKTFVVPGKKG